MKISVSMIVKNESSCLRECLESVKDADEIVIVDTGSEDNTIDIAKEYTDKVYSGEKYLWRDDFAFSRNQSLELCTNEWILIIDADEVLEEGGINKIRGLIKEGNAFYFDTVSKTPPHNIHKSIRLFKKGTTRWVGKIHNYLDTQTQESLPISIYYGYSEAHKKDPNRAMRILSKIVKEEPNCIREKFYLAREYYYIKDYKCAIFYYDYYLEVAKWAPEIADAWIMKAYCYWNLGEIDKAKDCALQAIKINANFKEAFVLMSKISGPKNSAKWIELSTLCTNEDVLFIRN